MPDTLSPAAPDLAFNPLDPAFIADPYPYYRRLREAAPVMRTPIGFWLVSRYEDAAFVLRDRRFGKAYAANMARRYGESAMNEPAIASMAKTMLVQDPPDHTRLRGLVTKAFTARRIGDMRARVAALVEEQLDRVAHQGHMDVAKDLAHRLPAIVICDMLGIPEDHRGPFLDASNVNGRILDPAPMSREEMDQANANSQAGAAYFSMLCDLRRKEPKDDLTTLLVQAEEAGDRLTTEELHANIGLLFGAGHETTSNLIGNGLLALHRNPGQLERLKRDPLLIPGAIEELLRYDSSVQITGRVAMEDVDVGGVAIPKGDSVILLLGACNRDPAMFVDPDSLDVTRPDVRPLSFGGGIHHCLGAQLARLEAELAFAALLRRFPTLELPEKDTPSWRRSFTLRGLTSLPAVWH